MRSKFVAALIVAVVPFALTAPHSASAGGLHRGDRVRSHYIPAPYPGGPDPYAYRYERRGYYPYYDSNYWVPLWQMKGRTHYPKVYREYGAAWGYPLSCKQQRPHRGCGVPYKRSHRRW